MDTITNVLEQASCEFALKNAECRHCEFCGKPFIRIELIMLKRPKTVYARPCNCWETQEENRLKRERMEFLKSKFDSANIGKRYEGVTLKSLANMGTEHTFEAKKYIKNFDPNIGKSIHMIGTFGNGKTSLAHAILKELIIKDFNCICMTWNEFTTRCHYAKSFESNETIKQILSWISKFDLVMLDEFTLNTKDDKEINLATALFEAWHKDNKSFILINNPCDILEMKKIPRLGKLLDRVKDQAEKYVFEHESYRGTK